MLRRWIVLILLLGLSSCATTAIVERAARDLSCAETMTDIQGESVHASGCGHWIEYVCQQSSAGVSCVEQRRGGTVSAENR